MQTQVHASVHIYLSEQNAVYCTKAQVGVFGSYQQALIVSIYHLPKG